MCLPDLITWFKNFLCHVNFFYFPKILEFLQLSSSLIFFPFSFPFLAPKFVVAVLWQLGDPSSSLNKHNFIPIPILEESRLIWLTDLSALWKEHNKQSWFVCDRILEIDRRSYKIVLQCIHLNIQCTFYM